MNLAADKILKDTLRNSIQAESARQIWLLTIANGAGHTQAAKAVASAWQKSNPTNPARVIEISEYMSPLARFTHVTAYLWLVKNAPHIWGKIDDYQKKQLRTSPDWFYRRECRKLFGLAQKKQPSAIVATEVGCAEVAALIKRDLQLEIPLVAVNVNYDADRAWIQPETDFYCVATNQVREDFIKLGAKVEKIAVWGVPMKPEFVAPNESERRAARREIGEWLGLSFDVPLILIAGGGEGLGKIEEIIKSLFASELNVSIIVLAGNNEKLKKNCEKAGKTDNGEKQLRVLAWTDRIPQLFRAADLLISKLGNTFDEAMTCGLPIIALEPPPGAERIQYKLLEKHGTGRAVSTVEEIACTVREILNDENLLLKMRTNSIAVSRTRAAEKVADWLGKRIQ